MGLAPCHRGGAIEYGTFHILSFSLPRLLMGLRLSQSLSILPPLKKLKEGVFPDSNLCLFLVVSSESSLVLDNRAPIKMVHGYFLFNAGEVTVAANPFTGVKTSENSILSYG
jgi:hypothetical protein